MTPPSLLLPGSRGRGGVDPAPLASPRSGALVGNGQDASPGPGLTLSRQFTFSVGYTILPHRAQLGFMAPGKAGAGTPGLARALSPRSELAGDGRGCNYTSGGGGGGWSKGTGLRLRPPSPNKHRGEEGLHRGGDAPRARAGARAARRAPREPGCCAEAGSGRGCGARGACLGESRGLPAPGYSQAGGAPERRRLCPRPSPR